MKAISYTKLRARGQVSFIDLMGFFLKKKNNYRRV